MNNTKSLVNINPNTLKEYLKVLETIPELKELKELNYIQYNVISVLKFYCNEKQIKNILKKYPEYLEYFI